MNPAYIADQEIADRKEVRRMIRFHGYEDFMLLVEAAWDEVKESQTATDDDSYNDPRRR